MKKIRLLLNLSETSIFFRMLSYWKTKSVKYFNYPLKKAQNAFLEEKNTPHIVSGERDEYENGTSIVDGTESSFLSYDEFGNVADIKNKIKDNQSVQSSQLSIKKANRVLKANSAKNSNEDNNSFYTASTVYTVTANTIGVYGLWISWWASIHEAKDVDYHAYDVYINGSIKGIKTREDLEDALKGTLRPKESFSFFVPPFLVFLYIFLFSA